MAGLAPQAAFWAGGLDIPEIALSRPINPVGDGDEVFGLQIVSTPGHTPGHIAVIEPESSSLMTGDSVFNIGGNLALPPADFTLNQAQALESARKLGAMGFERALFAHGPAIEQRAAEQIATLAAMSSAASDPAAFVEHRHNCLLHA